jgi:uncharacterized membrane protein
MIEKLKQILQVEKDLDPKLLKKISYTGMALSLLGIADGTYLTIAHYTTKVVLDCPDTGFINCAKVTTSQYSEIHGVPVALLGLLFFIAQFFLQLPLAWRAQVDWFRYLRLAFSGIGILMILWLLYVEFHLLHAICLFCSAAHILTLCLFIVTVIGTTLLVKEPEDETEKPKKPRAKTTR